MNDLQAQLLSAAGASEFEVPLSHACEWALDNGLELIVKEDRSSPLVSLQAWCRAGSIHEGKWLGAGLSHCLEHMLFKGTSRRAGNEIVQSVHDAGGYFNAYTSFNRTVYWVDVPKEGSGIALDILCDIVTSATLPEDDLEKEQEVIRREIAMGEDNPGQTLSRMLFSTAFAVHPCRYPVIGCLDVFNRVTRQDLADFYRLQYVPNNMFIVVVGDVDAEAIFGQVSGFFDAVPRGAFEPVLVPHEPRQLGRRDCHREFGAQLGRMSMAWHIPDVTHPDIPALDVLATVLGSGRSSRLRRVLREQEQLAHEIHAFAYTPAHEGLFGVGAVIDAERRGGVETRILDLIDEVKTDGVGEEEVGKARKILLSDQLQALASMRGQAADLGSSWLLARNVDFSREYLASVAGVTPEQVRAVAGKYLRQENLTSVSLSPKGSAPVRGGKGGARIELEVEKFTLDNGLTVLVRQDSRLPLVSCFASFRGGLLAESHASNGAVRLMSKTMIKGTLRSGARELADRIESAGGDISSGSGRNSFFLAVDVLRSELAQALDTAGEILLEPAFPADEVDKERGLQLAAIKEAEDHPFSVAASLMGKRLFGEHPYAMDLLGTRDSLAAIDAETMRGLHRDLVTGRNGVVAVFGDVSAVEVRRLLEERLDGLSTGEQAFADKAVAAKGVLSGPASEWKAMEKEQVIVMAGFAACNIFHEDRFALEMIDEICSDMTSRLFVRIREQMGLAYMVGSQLSYGFDPGSFVAYAGTAPGREDEVLEALLAEMDKLGAEGVTGEELARAKRTFLGRRLIGRQSNAALAEALAMEELYGLGWRHSEEETRRIEALTVEGVNAAAAAYFQDVPRVLVRAGRGKGTCD